MSYKRQAAANRDALFGAPPSRGPAPSPSATSRPSTAAPRRAPPTTSVPTTTTTTLRMATAPSSGRRVNYLSGEARAKKIQEAQEYRDKANQAMQRSFFSRPDPLAASTYYKRAADAYQQAGGMDRLERFYRLASAQCNEQIGVWPSTALDYTRAAELMALAVTQNPTDQDPEDAQITLEQKRRDASAWHKKAAAAWTQAQEPAKAAASQIQAAMALTLGAADGDDDDDDDPGRGRAQFLSREALTGLEEAVEAHVPDVLNPYARYRQTGHSAFIDPHSETETVENPSAETKALAQSHLVTRAYAHEPLQQLVHYLIEPSYREYASALYAAGAATVVLQAEDLSTLSLSRAFVTETILTLALGDVVLAEQAFLQRHVQKSSYLSSRECKLAEDLFRAVKTRDQEALEEARSPTGSNRAALANLSPPLRQLVTELRLSGTARAAAAAPAAPRRGPTIQAPAATAAAAADPSLQHLLNQKTGYEQEAAAGAGLDGQALQDELENLNLDDDDDDDDDDDRPTSRPGTAGQRVDDALDGLDDDDDDDDFDLR